MQKIYKNSDNQIYILEDYLVSALLPLQVLTEITDEEAEAIRVSKLPTIDLQIAINQESLAYLASTDWYVTRFAETGVAIPDAIKVLRAEARAKIV